MKRNKIKIFTILYLVVIQLSLITGVTFSSLCPKDLASGLRLNQAQTSPCCIQHSCCGRAVNKNVLKCEDCGCFKTSDNDKLSDIVVKTSAINLNALAELIISSAEKIKYKNRKFIAAFKNNFYTNKTLQIMRTVILLN